MTHIWGEFERDPRHGANADLRASDRDRDVVREVVATAYAEGRLTHEEFEERTDQVNAARTLGDLPGLVSDLVPVGSDASPVVRVAPQQLRKQAEEQYVRSRHQALLAMLFPTIICWTIWIAVGLGADGTWFPWPLFVTLGTGWRWFSMISNKEVAIQQIQHDLAKKLERKERRRLERGRQGRSELENPGGE